MESHGRYCRHCGVVANCGPLKHLDLILKETEQQARDRLEQSGEYAANPKEAEKTIKKAVNDMRDKVITQVEQDRMDFERWRAGARLENVTYVGDKENPKYLVKVSASHGPICCPGIKFDQRSSSSIELTHPAIAAEIKKFMLAICAGEFNISGTKTDEELRSIKIILKVNVRPLNHLDACTFLFCPVDGQERIKYEGFKQLGVAQKFPLLTEHSQLAYWCKEHKLAFRVGRLEVKWSGNGSFATCGNKDIDKAMTLPTKVVPDYGYSNDEKNAKGSYINQ